MTANSGYLIQPSMGGDHAMPAAPANFELVVPSDRGGFVHSSRHNDQDGFPWTQEAFFGAGYFDGGSLIQRSDLHGEGDLEVLARVGDRLGHYRRETGKWKEPVYIGSGISGRPALIQSRYGRMGNYEVVVPVAAGGLAYYRRQNDDPALPWSSPVFFAAGLGDIEGVALLQSTFGSPGNLEIVGCFRQGSQRRLLHFWSDQSSGRDWFGPNEVPLPQGLGPSGVPSFLQSQNGDFELVAPLTDGSACHLTRLNNDPNLPWTAPRIFGGGGITEVSMIESSFGNLELVTRKGARYEHYWFDRASSTWQGPTAIAWQEPALDLPAVGRWDIPFSCSVVGIHALLLSTGRVLLFAYLAADDQGRGISCVLDPANGQEIRLPDLQADPFCGGHAALPDGRFLVAGGSGGGLKALQLFSPSGQSGAWSQLADMPDPRWYPTCLTLPDGRILILSGTREGGTQPDTPLNDTFQIYSPAAGLSDPVAVPYLDEISPVSIYPFAFLLPSGEVLLHGWNKTAFFDPASGTVRDTRILTIRSEPRNYPVQGSAVLLPLIPDADPPYRTRILLVGGGGVPPGTQMAATETCEILDLGAENPQWQQAPPMAFPRVMPDAVLLPDETVLVTNGSLAGWAHDANQPVYDTEIYNPVTNEWSRLCTRRVPRLYHSTALLLPDGRVLTAGSDETYNIEPFHKHELRIEIFSPPYLFRGARPAVASAPSNIAYGQQFAVQTPDADSIASIVLLRPGASTHSTNMEQRCVRLRFESRTGARLNVQAPPDGRIAPPGYYMMFLVNGTGVPSLARFVKLG